MGFIPHREAPLAAISTKSGRDRELAEAQRRYIEHVARSTGLTLTEIARRAGKSHTTLTKFMANRERGPLNASTVNDIATALAIPANAEIRGAPGELREEAEPFISAQDKRLGPAVEALLRGRQNADPWILRTRALEGYGYMPGDVVIVDLGVAPRAGVPVCAQVYDWNHAAAETVWRIYEPPYLIAYSTDPDLRRPLLVDNDRVIVRGVITDLLRSS